MTSKSRSNVPPAPPTSATAAAELQETLRVERLRIEDISYEDDMKERSTAFKQQQLSSWQPTIVPGVASPTLFFLAIICLPVGIGILHFANEIHVLSIDYTDCVSLNDSNKNCSELMGPEGPEPGKTCECQLPFRLTVDLKGTVFMYYELTNFYQNHRRYVRSRDDVQLYGGTAEPSSHCAPFEKTKDGKFYWPCGGNARSMFQDDIHLFFKSNNASDVQVKLKQKGIAWPSDKAYKFKNPTGWKTPKFHEEHVKPEPWIKDPWNLDPKDDTNNGLENEDFIVWMRTAALPNFRKLYRIIDDGLKKGDYYLMINYSFPVKSYSGTKSIIFSTMSILGGKNPFLGICFMIVGTICLCMGFLFFGIRLLERRTINPARVGVGIELADGPSSHQSSIRT